MTPFVWKISWPTNEGRASWRRIKGGARRLDAFFDWSGSLNMARLAGKRTNADNAIVKRDEIGAAGTGPTRPDP